MEQGKKDFNALNKEIATLKKAKQDAAEQMEKSKEIKARIAELEEREKELSAARDAALLPIGNLVHDSVPVSNDEVRPSDG
ncbi:seryl-tRNA synthetase [Monoraphidium neglectum]|uniref:Seryl-tRNA synthetase n=1 Tax=Monoraphidium neglectum TaxID=145388 RepID=A0A0D2J3D7_9CHLO|nr:seryl-tRNA synthetase [Monoraphidium neglectum]KIY94472.1 seryl-tRNA synthetase [Monoraphidium neglectum]|eukprot:XP_013893492.1 seryl-tRNA synthetase [Monoraphidium neglectum]